MTGIKDVADDALEGLSIVVTGVFDCISRDDLVNFIKDKGGKSPGSVSGKTNYLIAGLKLEDGRDPSQGNKYKNAVAKGVKIFTED